MRFGCCVNMLVPLDQGTGVEMAERVAAAGFDYLELPVARFAPVSDLEFESIRLRVQATGLAVESCNDFFPPEMKLVGPAADRSKILAYADRALKRAALLGAKNIVFGSGGARTAPDGFPIGEACEQLVNLLRVFGPLAEQHDLTISIEPLNRTECNIILNLVQACELAKRVAHPHVQVLADYYHLALEREPLDHVAAALPHIRHIHFSNPAGRGYPQVADENFTEFCRLLRENGYDNRMSVEAFSQNFESDAAATLKLLRKMMK
jgi:sugar phosphate isomerase/epimerase